MGITREQFYAREMTALFASNPVLGAESVSGAHVAGRTAGANPATGATQPDAAAQREAIARIIRCFVRGYEYAWSGIRGEYEAADAIIASGLMQDEAVWRDISTAPKDGRYILAARFKRDELKWVQHSRWMTPEDVAEQEGGASADDYDAGWTDGDDEGDYCYPTHWMPLPAPPIRSARDGGAES